MGGSGMMDFMVKSYRSNRKLLKNGKKSLKTIYEETREYDPDTKRLFLEKFHTRQNRPARDGPFC